MWVAKQDTQDMFREQCSDFDRRFVHIDRHLLVAQRHMCSKRLAVLHLNCSITEFDGAVVQIDKHLLHAQRHMLSDPLALLHLLHVNLSAMHANGMACQQLCCILT